MYISYFPGKGSDLERVIRVWRDGGLGILFILGLQAKDGPSIDFDGFKMVRLYGLV